MSMHRTIKHLVAEYKNWTYKFFVHKKDQEKDKSKIINSRFVANRNNSKHKTF